MAGAWSGLMAMSGNGLKPSIQRYRRQSRSNVVNGCGETQNLSKELLNFGWIWAVVGRIFFWGVQVDDLPLHGRNN